jgi:aspartate/glutamate racemase
MTASSRFALLHTGAVNIAPFAALARTHLPDATAINLLDDRIVADLADPQRAASVPDRVTALVQAAADAGAEMVLMTCSSISPLAREVSQKVGIPVLRIDEAMADEAVVIGDRIAVIATLPTTLTPTTTLIRERAALAGREPVLTSEVVEGAFAAVSGGDRAEHDRLVAAAIERLAAEADVVVLAQASMASAADAVTVDVPVLTSSERGVLRLREALTRS